MISNARWGFKVVAFNTPGIPGFSREFEHSTARLVSRSFRLFARWAGIVAGLLTLSILSPCDLEKLLDVGDLGRHVGGIEKSVCGIEM